MQLQLSNVPHSNRAGVIGHQIRHLRRSNAAGSAQQSAVLIRLPSVSRRSSIFTVSASAAPSGSSHALAAPSFSAADAAGSPSAPPLKIVFVSAEVAPWSKTGGLGDVAGGLPIALAERGHHVYTIAPRYDQYRDAWDTSVRANIDGEDVGFFHTEDKGVNRIWVDHGTFLAKVKGKTGSKLYGAKSGSDYADNLLRFKLFNLAALEAVRQLPFGPGEDCLFVCNDWHTALLPVLLKDVFQPRGEFVNAKTALTIHNIAFQGRFWAKDWEKLGLPESSRAKFTFQDGYPRVYNETESEDAEEVAPPGSKFDKLNWLQAGIQSADKLLTVSPTYAKEMTESEQKGCELDSVIRSVGGIEGIVNGMDTTEWCPTQDKFLDLNYDEETVAEGKAFAKETLQAEVGLPVDPSAPLFGFIGRLEQQKGVDVLLESLPKVLGASAGGNSQVFILGTSPAELAAKVVILGTGIAKLEAKVEALASQYPGSAAGVAEFNSSLAHLITAGADFMLVPSRFEPCGLIQMHAMQYGTVPVVSSTGGLVDTVKDGVTGFHAGQLDPDDLVQADVDSLAAAVNRAAGTYNTPQYTEMRAKCIGQELSWEVPAAKWESVLRDVQAGAKNQVAVEQGPTPVKNVDMPAAPKKSDITAGRAAPKGSSAPQKPRNIGEAVQQAQGGSSSVGGVKGAITSAAATSGGQAASGRAGAPQQAASKPAAAAAAAKPAQRAAAGGAAKPAAPTKSAQSKSAVQKPAASAAPNTAAGAAKAPVSSSAAASKGAAKPAAKASAANGSAAKPEATGKPVASGKASASKE